MENQKLLDDLRIVEKDLTRALINVRNTIGKTITELEDLNKNGKGD